MERGVTNLWPRLSEFVDHGLSCVRLIVINKDSTERKPIVSVFGGVLLVIRVPSAGIVDIEGSGCNQERLVFRYGNQPS